MKEQAMNCSESQDSIRSNAAFLGVASSVGSTGAAYKRETNTTADTVMRMPARHFVPRKCVHCEKAEKQLQRKPLTPFIQRQEKKEGKKEEKKDPLEAGFSKLREELLKNPKIKPYTQQLKLHLWDDQPDEFKYSIVGFGVTNLAIMTSFFAFDRVFREKTISFLDNKDLFTPLSLIPKSEYFILKSAKYKLPKKDEKEIEFDGEFDFSPYFKLFHNQFLSSIKPGFSLNFKYNTDTGHLSASGGTFNIKFYRDIFSISGSFDQSMLKPPGVELGPDPFDPRFRKIPDSPSGHATPLPHDTHFMFTVDIAKFFQHDDKKKKPTDSAERLQRKELFPFIQKKEADGSSMEADEQVATQINQTKGGGHTMDSHTRSFMESRFDANFSGVRIHTDNAAAKTAQDLSAQAFTYGRDIYFNNGKYNPTSAEGKHLLAHELTHTLQQSGDRQSTVIQRDLAVETGHPDAIAAALTQEQVDDAIRYNTRRFNLRDEWEISLVRDVLGLPSEPAIVDRDLIEMIAQYQAENGITADGKVGPITASRLSRELFHESRGLTGRARVALLRSSRRMGTRAMRIRVNNPAHLLDHRGSAELGVMWEIPDASANGFVIQHLRVNGNIQNCSGHAVAMNGFEGARDYWEVWRVINGRVQCGTLAGPCTGSDDTFTTTSQPAGTKGTIVESGRVSFFPDYLLDRRWITGVVHPAGDLPHRATRPPFWNEGETMLHQMRIVYDDCVLPATSTVTSVP